MQHIRKSYTRRALVMSAQGFSIGYGVKNKQGSLSVIAD
jgi:hypothetical protein